jgi:hypothetical protein
VTLEAICLRCGEVFIPADEFDLIHGQREDGAPCMGMGTITGEWIRPRRYRSDSGGNPTVRRLPGHPGGV